MAIITGITMLAEAVAEVVSLMMTPRSIAGKVIPHSESAAVRPIRKDPTASAMMKLPMKREQMGWAEGARAYLLSGPTPRITQSAAPKRAVSE
jgi:hypothetical protein